MIFYIGSSIYIIFGPILQIININRKVFNSPCLLPQIYQALVNILSLIGTQS